MYRFFQEHKAIIERWNQYMVEQKMMELKNLKTDWTDLSSRYVKRV